MVFRPKETDPIVTFSYCYWRCGFMGMSLGTEEWSVGYPASRVIAWGEEHRQDDLLLVKSESVVLSPQEVYDAADWVKEQVASWQKDRAPKTKKYQRPEGLEDLDGLEHFAVRMSVGLGGPEDPTIEFWKKEPYALIGALRVSVLKTADKKQRDIDLKFDGRYVLLHEHVARVGIWVAQKLVPIQRVQCEPPVPADPVDPDRVQTERVKKLQTMFEEQQQHLLKTVTDEDAKADLLDELTRLYRDKMMEVLRNENAP